MKQTDENSAVNVTNVTNAYIYIYIQHLASIITIKRAAGTNNTLLNLLYLSSPLISKRSFAPVNNIMFSSKVRRFAARNRSFPPYLLPTISSLTCNYSIKRPCSWRSVSHIFTRLINTGLRAKYLAKYPSCSSENRRSKFRTLHLVRGERRIRKQERTGPV